MNSKEKKKSESESITFRIRGILFLWCGHLFLSSCFVHCTCIRLCAHKRVQATTVQTSRPSGAKGCPFVHHQCTCPVRLHPFLFLNPCLLRASSRSPDIVHTLFHYLTCELEHIASITITFKTAIEDNNNTTLTKKLRYIHLTILLSHCQNSNQTSSE